MTLQSISIKIRGRGNTSGGEIPATGTFTFLASVSFVDCAPCCALFHNKNLYYAQSTSQKSNSRSHT